MKTIVVMYLYVPSDQLKYTLMFNACLLQMLWSSFVVCIEHQNNAVLKFRKCK